MKTLKHTSVEAVVVEAHATPRQFLAKHPLKVLAGGVLILTLGWGWWVWRQGADLPRVTVSVNDLDALQYEANTVARQQGISAGLRIYGQAIPEAADKTTRANLDTQAADLALNYNQPATAMAYALQADELLHTPDSSSLVASIYAQQGNRTSAVAYYRKAASEVTSHQISGDSQQYYLSEARQAAAGAATL